MSNIFNISNLSAARVDAITSGHHGSYTYDFRSATADRLDRLSLGFSRRALEAMAGHLVVMQSQRECGRLEPVVEQFPEDLRDDIAAGSFSRQALRGYTNYVYDNGLFFDFNAVALCLDCGKLFRVIPTAHRCGEIECTDCGATITTDEERRAHKCKACAARSLGHIYSYHYRPNRGRPIFEKPDMRTDELHMGAEIEIDGCNRDAFNDDDAAEFSAILNNKNPFKPFIEFEHDASLDGGIECITAPTTFGGLWKMRKDLDAFYKTANSLGGTFERRNGLHFHIDREFFGRDPEERGKASVLIDLMVYKFYDFFMAISRRERGVTNYARKKDGVTGIYGAFSNVRFQDHCYAVNGGGSATIELRFFGGHISTADDFLAAADIVQAIARWAKATSIAGATTCTPCDLVKYLRKPDNVLAFVEGVIPQRPTTREADAQINDFKTALNARIERANARREEV